MFVRKKKNKSGVISIQIIDKSSGRYKVLKTIGSSKDPGHIMQLFRKGKEFIKNYKGQQSLNYPEQDLKELVKSSIRGINIEGPSLLLGRIYSEIGFDRIGGGLLKQLVLIRLTHPASKLK